MALRDFFEDIIRPNLVELVGWLRVSEIQSQLMSARVITRTDDQKLRHEMKIELDKARYLLHDVLAYVDNRTFDKFRQIVKGSGKDVPTHRLAAELLYKESVHAKLTEPASIDHRSVLSRDQFSDKEQDSFIQALAGGKVCVYRAHIHVVGQDGVGKTCFVLALLKEAFKGQGNTDGVAVKVIGKEAANWKEFAIGGYVDKADKALVKSWQATNQQPNQEHRGQSSGLADSISTEARQEQWQQESKSDSKVSAVGAEEIEVDLEALNLNITDDDLAAIKKVIEDDPEVLQQKESKLFLAIVWEHSGQEPFLPSHSALLGNMSLSLPSHDDPISECTQDCDMYVIVFDQSKLLTGNVVSKCQPDPKKPSLSYEHCCMKQNVDYLCYWLTQLQCAFPKMKKKRQYMGYSRSALYPAIMVVGTHDADPKAEENRDEQNRTLNDVFKSKKYQGHLVKPGNGDQFFRVENTLSGAEGGDPAKAVRDTIEEMTETCWSGQEQPLKWFVVERILKRLVQITGRHIIDLPFFKDLAIKLCGIASEHINLLLKYLSNLRVVLHFSDMQSSRHTFLIEELRDKVFIDPQWLFKIISLFVTINLEDVPELKSEWDHLQSTGILEWSLVKYFLGEKKANIPAKYQKAVIGFLCLVDLICPVHKSAELGDHMKFYAPGLITTLYEEVFEWRKWKAEVGLPPPLILAPTELDTFPEPLYQRLVVRLLAKYDADNSTLHRNRSLFAIGSDLDLELAYHKQQYVIATVTSYGKMIKLGNYEEFVDLRKYLVDEIDRAKEPGMNGFEFELCAIAKREKLSPEDIKKDSPDMVSLKRFSPSRYLRPKIRKTQKAIDGEYHKIFSRWFDSSSAFPNSSSPSPKKRKADTCAEETFCDSEVTADCPDVAPHTTMLLGAGRPLRSQMTLRKAEDCLDIAELETASYQEGLTEDLSTVGKESVFITRTVRAPTGGADEVVTPKELRNLAKVIGGCWVEFALDLAPNMFQVRGNISTIQTDTNYGSASIKAQAMLEMWRNEMDTKATRRLLIQALCSNSMRRQACDLFGTEVTNIVSPQ